MKFTMKSLVAAGLLAPVLAAALVPVTAEGQVGSEARVVPPGLSRAVRFFDAGRYEEASGGLQAILKIPEYREDPDVLWMAGVCLLEVGNSETARAYFERALQADPAMAEAYFGLARAHATSAGDGGVGEVAAYVLEAAGYGLNVLGRIPQTPELRGIPRLTEAQFTKRVLDSMMAGEIIDATKHDPFDVPRTPVDEDLSSSRRAQRRLIEKLEVLWEGVPALIHSEEEDQRRLGLNGWNEIVDRMGALKESISDPGVRARTDDLEAAMKEELPQVRLILLKVNLEEGTHLVTSMRTSLGENRYSEVIRLYDEELQALRDRMVAIDEYFKPAADEILDLGWGLREEAVAGMEIGALQLEVRGIVMCEAARGEDPVKTAIIINLTETPPRDPSPPQWEPRQRLYSIGSTVHQVDHLRIHGIERNKVIFLYKDRYEVDLALRRPGGEE